MEVGIVPEPGNELVYLELNGQEVTDQIENNVFRVTPGTESLTFYATFRRVYLVLEGDGGELVDSDNQIIILPASLLNTLAPGDHSFEAYFTEPDSGSAKATSGTVSIAVMTELMIAVWSVIRKTKREE